MPSKRISREDRPAPAQRPALYDEPLVIIGQGSSMRIIRPTDLRRHATRARPTRAVGVGWPLVVALASAMLGFLLGIAAVH